MYVCIYIHTYTECYSTCQIKYKIYKSISIRHSPPQLLIAGPPAHQTVADGWLGNINRDHNAHDPHGSSIEFDGN